MDDEIGVGHELGVAAVAFVQDRSDLIRLRARAPERIGKWLMVDQVNHRYPVGLDPVAQRHGRVIEVLRRHSRAADRVDALGQVVIDDLGGQLVEFDGKIGKLHLAGEHVMQGAAAAFRTIDRNGISPYEGWTEEGETLDVIPMRVAEENAHAQVFLALRHEVGGESMRTRTAIEDKKIASVGRQFNAGGIPAEMDRSRPGGSDRSSRAPKANLHDLDAPMLKASPLEDDPIRR